VSDSRVRGLLVLAILACVAGLPGCGKSPITISLTATGVSGGCTSTNSTSACAVTINQGATESVSASVANDKTNSGVTWSLGSSVGSLSSQTTTSVVYVAPAAISSTTTATLTATSVANTGVSAILTITINAVFQFETNSLPVATVDVPYTATISTVGASGPFTWVILSGNLPQGLTLSSSDTASVTITGTPTTAGTSTVTMQATDGSGTPISETLTIVVNPPPVLTITTPGVLTPGTVGQPYNFTLQAEFGTPPYSWSIVSGSGDLPPGLSLSTTIPGLISGTPTTQGTSTFTVEVKDSASPNAGIATKSVSITINQALINSELIGNYAFLVSGFDPNGKTFAAAGSFSAAGGNISSGTIDANDAGTVESLTNVAGNYTLGTDGLGTLTFAGRTFAMSFVPTTSATGIPSANLIEFDNTDQASGMLVQQNSGAFSIPAGNYVFGFLGGDKTNQRYALAGAFSASGTSGSGVLDSDDAGTHTNTAFTLPVLNAPNTSSGRGTLALSIAGVATNYSYYVVSASQILVVEIDQAPAPTVSGTILAQSGSLGASSLSDGVFETTAVTSGAALSQLGVITTDGSSTLGTSFDQNTGGATKTSTGSYSVGTSGRVTLTNSGLGTSDPVLYLAQTNEGFLVGTDTAVTSGFMTAQGATSSLSGTYAGGSIAPALAGPSGEVDAASASGGILTIDYDASTTGGLLQNQSTTTSYTAPASNGRGTIPQAGSPTDVFYLVSPTEYWDLSVSTGGMVRIFQQ
jgi:hypothetical protein